THLTPYSSICISNQLSNTSSYIPHLHDALPTLTPIAQPPPEGRGAKNIRGRFHLSRCPPFPPRSKSPAEAEEILPPSWRETTPPSSSHKPGSGFPCRA